jgi:hypothetical protein
MKAKVAVSTKRLGNRFIHTFYSISDSEDLFVYADYCDARLERQYVANCEWIEESTSTIPQLCQSCVYFAHHSQILCVVNPLGPTNNFCSDFQSISVNP